MGDQLLNEHFNMQKDLYRSIGKREEPEYEQISVNDINAEKRTQAHAEMALIVN